MMKTDPFGCHRVLEPKGALPQAAQRLDNDFSKLADNELLLSVDVLNIDAASFRQMEESGGPESVAEQVMQTVSARGKQHNPVTGSGGMLLGRVKAIGPALSRRSWAAELSVGDRVATLVSLTLTPLRIDRVRAVHSAATQVEVDGEAVLFESGVFAKVPTDFPDRLVLAALDVAGAAPQVARIVSPGHSVLILGAGGKSGILCAYEARRRLGSTGRLVGLETLPGAAAELEALGLCDEVVVGDGRDPVGVRQLALAANHGREFDRTISCVNVPDTEMSAILSTVDRGLIYFFAMSTSFTKAALGAEGVGKDVDLMIGNGYAHDHAEHTLDILRDSRAIRDLFARRYAS